MSLRSRRLALASTALLALGVAACEVDDTAVDSPTIEDGTTDGPEGPEEVGEDPGEPDGD